MRDASSPANATCVACRRACVNVEGGRCFTRVRQYACAQFSTSLRSVASRACPVGSRGHLRHSDSERRPKSHRRAVGAEQLQHHPPSDGPASSQVGHGTDCLFDSPRHRQSSPARAAQAGEKGVSTTQAAGTSRPSTRQPIPPPVSTPSTPHTHLSAQGTRPPYIGAAAAPPAPVARNRHR